MGHVHICGEETPVDGRIEAVGGNLGPGPAVEILDRRKILDATEDNYDITETQETID